MIPAAPPPAQGTQLHGGARRRRLVAAILLSLPFAALAGPLATAGDGPSASTPAARRAPRWSSAILELARTLPVQDGGRVKPLDTYAQFALLRLNHKRSCQDLDGNTLSSIEWLLDVLFRPELARRYACFTVDSSEVLDSVGLDHEGKKKRDRYAYDDLAAARPRLGRLAERLHGKQSKERSPAEEGIASLSDDLETFDALIHALDFARAELRVDGSAGLAALFGGRRTVPVMAVVDAAAEVRALSGAGDPHAGGASPVAPAGSDGAAATALRARVGALAEAAAVLSLVPPAESKADRALWFTPGHILFALVEGGSPAPEQVEIVRRLAAMQASSDDLGAFEREAHGLHDAAAGLATRRGEYDKVDLEVFLYRLDPFYRAVWLYVLAFLAVAVTWLRPSRWLTRLAWGCLLAAVGLQVAGVVIRCVLRGRPPISTLYETTLFISALGGIACLFAERITRRGIALAAAPIMGGLTQFVANRFEVMKGEDTMPQLVAVLDTNFWLALHVTCITIGYSGGLVAALLGNAHVLGRALGVKRASDEGYRALARMTYGMLSFGLVFSVVGTILGGIWANESWGRFWGWDPKENGALLICLAQLAILHLRMGGHLRAFGVAMASVAQGLVIAFSWWGVNLLQIGLHSYGFSGGIWNGLKTLYLVEGAVLVAGFATLALGRAYGGGGPSLPDPHAR